MTNHHEGIIKRDEYETVQSMLKTRRPNQITKYALTNITYCNKCHRKLHRHLINHNRPSEYVVLNCNHNPTVSIDCTYPRISYDLVLGSVKDSIHELLNHKDVLDELKSMLLSVSEHDDTSSLHSKRLRLNALIAAKANGLNEKIISEEKALRKEIEKLENKVSFSVRSNNLLQVIDSVISDQYFVNDSLLIKSFYKLVIVSPEELVFVISGSKDTEELSYSIDELSTIPSLFSKLYIDYDLQKGIKYRVVYHV